MAQIHKAPETKSSSVPAIEGSSSHQPIYTGSWTEYSLPTETDTQLFELLDKYRPETPQDKKKRMMKRAKQRAQGKEDTSTTKRPAVVRQGVNTVTSLVEQKKALLVVIANDVEPISLVSHLPNLCIKNGVPYCIVKDKCRLGRFVTANICSCLALSTINSEDTNKFKKLLESLESSMAEFNKIAESSRRLAYLHRGSSTNRRSKSQRREQQRSNRKERGRQRTRDRRSRNKESRHRSESPNRSQRKSPHRNSSHNRYHRRDQSRSRSH